MIKVSVANAAYKAKAIKYPYLKILCPVIIGNKLRFMALRSRNKEVVTVYPSFPDLLPNQFYSKQDIYYCDKIAREFKKGNLPIVNCKECKYRYKCITNGWK